MADERDDGVVNDSFKAEETSSPAPANATTQTGFITVNVSNSSWIVRSRYTDIEIVGHGAYGVVCCAFDKTLGRTVAIKKLSRPFENVEYATRTYRELNILAQMDHENIICLIDAFSPQKTFETFTDLYLVTPMMNADLSAIISSQQLIDDQVAFLVYQILRALKYMHSAGLIHRDLKPANIAVNEDCELKILDFGLARQRSEEMSGYVTTRWYRAPEVMLSWMHYNESVDVWSTACIMYELRTQKPLFPGANHIDQLDKIIKVVGTPDAKFIQKITSKDAREFLRGLCDSKPQEFGREFSPEAVDFLRKMLKLDPDHRLNATQALAHPYLSRYHDERDEPDAEPFTCPLQDRTNVTLNEYKGEIWRKLQNFVPNINSLKLSSSSETAA